MLCFLFLTPSSFSVYRRVRTKSHEREPVPKIASLFILDSIYIYSIPGTGWQEHRGAKGKEDAEGKGEGGLMF